MTGEIDRGIVIGEPTHESKPLIVTDLALAIAQRQITEEAFMRTGGTSPDVIPMQLLEGPRAILVQREWINGEVLSDEEAISIISDIDLAALSHDKLDYEFTKRLQTALPTVVSSMWNIYRQTDNDPNYHLNMGRKIDAAARFSQEKGVSIENVYRDETLFIEFVRSQITPSQVITSIDVLMSDKNMMEIVKIFQKLESRLLGAEETVALDQDDPDLIEIIREAAIKTRNEAVGHYITRFFSTSSVPPVEE
jgi:hypothetical protein